MYGPSTRGGVRRKATRGVREDIEEGCEMSCLQGCEMLDRGMSSSVTNLPIVNIPMTALRDIAFDIHGEPWDVTSPTMPCML